MRVLVALWGLVCLGLAGLNLFVYLELGHHWPNLVAAPISVGAGLLCLFGARK